MKQIDKIAIERWEQYRDNLRKFRPLPNESISEKNSRIDKLKNNPESFFKYYFESYASAEPADFHKSATKRIINNDVWFEVRAWARDHAKSVRAMMEVIYLAMTGRLKNFLLVSYSKEKADELLMPFMIQLESNQRLINDFGSQKNIGQWQNGKFVTMGGISFRSIGSGQSPRGTRNEETRPDFILVDDMDEDELCRNERRMDEAYNWMMGALFPCFDIKGSKRFLVIGNIISKNSIIVRAAEKCDYYSQINILDKKGVPSWKERYSLKECQYMIDKLGYILSQREYFNNPISEGKIFRNIQYKKILPYERYQYLVCYTDPSFKNSSKNDFKAIVLIGKTATEFHVIKAYVEQTTVRNMVLWHYHIHDMVKDKKPVFFYMESNFIQDMLFEEFVKTGKDMGWQLPIRGDDRKKPDKSQRIEALEPYFSRGQFFFAEEQQNDPHMRRLVEQFKAFEKGSKIHDDGPDACEGAVHILNNKTRTETPMLVKKRITPNKYRI